MTSLLIVADDLSGAADCASACRHHGLSASVSLNPLVIPNSQNNAGEKRVLAVDAHSRNLRPDQAADLHCRILKHHLTKTTALYKKVDSTFRGNIGAEIAATVALAGMAILAPAFPATGRSTIDGQQWVHGTELSKTQIWRNDGQSGTADIAQMMQAEGLRVVKIPLSEIRDPTTPLQDRFLACAQAGVDVLVCDAEQAYDLERIARSSINLPAHYFWAGSAGLMEYVAQALKQEHNAAQITLPAVNGRVLTIAGSMSTICAEQVRQLNKQRDIQLVTAPAGTLTAGESHAHWPALCHSLTAALERGDAIIGIPDDNRVERAAGAALCLALGRLVAPQVARLGAIVATGGETARAVFDAVKITALHLAGDVEEGVPISLATGALTLPVITKAGAFGNAQTLVRCYDTLRG